MAVINMIITVVVAAGLVAGCGASIAFFGSWALDGIKSLKHA